MKKYCFIFLVILAAVGCAKKNPEVILAKVNNYEISLNEFEEEFKNSASGMADTLDSRKEFLNNLINRKVILQEAQRQNLDKEGDFLKLIEKFWEQSLLRVTLERKLKEVTSSIVISDKAIKDTYDKLKEKGRIVKPYDEIYPQLKWDIMKLKEAEVVNQWVDNLRKKSKINVNYDLLKAINKEG